MVIKTKISNTLIAFIMILTLFITACKPLPKSKGSDPEIKPGSGPILNYDMVTQSLNYNFSRFKDFQKEIIC